MEIELATLSADEYRKICSGRMTPAMAAEYLRSGQLTLRSFGNALQEMCPGTDLQSRLTAAFLSDSPGSNADSVNRKIRNWLSDQNMPGSREDIFHIAFALSLSEAQTNYLLGICTDYGIHYREGRDLVYAWFLRRGRGYGEARDFFAALPPVPRLTQVPDDPNSHLTHELQNDVLRIQIPEDLCAYYISHLDRLGVLHMRAFSYFQRYLNQLIRPTSILDGITEPDYSMEAVMKEYFSLRMPSGKKHSGYTVVQKLVKQNWPNTTSLKNIRNYKEDVPRKLILLLYVITENVFGYNYCELDEDYISMDQRVEDHWWSLNAILADCGMPRLDPRNPTDWLVLYAIAADDEPMSERLEKVIECIFGNTD